MGERNIYKAVLCAWQWAIYFIFIISFNLQTSSLELNPVLLTPSTASVKNLISSTLLNLMNLFSFFNLFDLTVVFGTRDHTVLKIILSLGFTVQYCFCFPLAWLAVPSQVTSVRFSSFPWSLNIFFLGSNSWNFSLLKIH